MTKKTDAKANTKQIAIGEDVHRELVKFCEKEGRKINAMATILIKKGLDEMNKQ